MEEIGVVKAKDKGIISVFIDYEVSKDIINNSEEVFSAFDNSGDKDY
jgi:hypothetical protein